MLFPYACKEDIYMSFSDKYSICAEYNILDNVNTNNAFDLFTAVLLSYSIFRPSIHWHLPCSICMEREHEYVVKWQSFINQVQT